MKKNNSSIIFNYFSAECSSSQMSNFSEGYPEIFQFK